MDRWTEQREEIERWEGTEGSSQNQKREQNERVAWTAERTRVFSVCLIDHMVKDNMRISRKLCEAVDGVRKDGM